MVRTRGGAQKRPRQQPPRKSPSRVSAPAPAHLSPFASLDFSSLDFPSIDPLLSTAAGPSTSTVPSTPLATDFVPSTQPSARARARSKSRSRSGSSRSGSSRSGSSRSGSSRSGSARSTNPTPPRTPTGIRRGGSGGARRRLLLTNSPNFGPIQGQKRPGQRVTVTETRTVTTLKKRKTSSSKPNF